MNITMNYLLNNRINIYNIFYILYTIMKIFTYEKIIVIRL